MAVSEPSPVLDPIRLAADYRRVRGASEQLSEPLATEDFVVQSMPDVSPTKWHLAHVSWFFETFVLRAYAESYREFDPAFGFLFNSYYNMVGEQHSRPERGLLTRPTVEDVFHYRRHVDEAMLRLLEEHGEIVPELALEIVGLGLHHEQQHQELLLMDIKHVLSRNPLHPVYAESASAIDAGAGELDRISFPEGLREIGYAGEGFAFDNEGPRHRVHLVAFALATRLTTNAEYLEFVADRGYSRPELWLSDGWAELQRHGIEAPLYWLREGDGWSEFTLSGRRELHGAEPVCHLSYYEADAFARWAGARLPREAEWEVAAGARPLVGNFVENGLLHPAPATGPGSDSAQLFGDLWEWTLSAYLPYPGYRAVEGALGEYNGKFMCNQMVLRGGCCATPRNHIRASYRNFFYPHQRWQFSGLRLAWDE